MIFTAHQRSCEKVIFSAVSVCSQGVTYVTITHDALDITVQAPLVPAQAPWILDLGPLLGSDILWSSLETCTNMLIWGPLNSNIWWPTLEAWKPVQTCSLEFPIPSLRSEYLVVVTEAHTAYWNTFLWSMSRYIHVKSIWIL